MDLVDCSEILARLRWKKSREEIGVMETASKIADTVMGEVTKKVAPGVSELDLVSEVEYQLRKHGAKTPSRDEKVGFVGRAALGIPADADHRGHVDGDDDKIEIFAHAAEPLIPQCAAQYA